MADRAEDLERLTIKGMVRAHNGDPLGVAV
jgi:hypothetical protein